MPPRWQCPRFPRFASDAKAPRRSGRPRARLRLPSPTSNQGSAKFTAVCAACHGADGNSGVPANPKLAQQHPEYLVKQLQEFKSGKRASPIMQAFAAQLSDADMKNIALTGPARRRPSRASPRTRTWSHWARSIYRGGIADRQVAACAGCHSPNGAGIPAQYPRLSGQHADYTDAQLTAFRDGARKNSLQMTPDRRQAERPRDPGRGRLHCRPALMQARS